MCSEYRSLMLKVRPTFLTLKDRKYLSKTFDIFLYYKSLIIAGLTETTFYCKCSTENVETLINHCYCEFMRTVADFTSTAVTHRTKGAESVMHFNVRL